MTITVGRGLETRLVMQLPRQLCHSKHSTCITVPDFVLINPLASWKKLWELFEKVPTLVINIILLNYHHCGQTNILWSCYVQQIIYCQTYNTCVQILEFFSQKKFQDLGGNRTHTSTTPVWCSTSWATKPLGVWQHVITGVPHKRSFAETIYCWSTT